MKKILIVDDMIVSLMMTENMLSGEYETFCASSGQEAIDIYRKEHPDMVLSDLRMPGMSGYELQQTLQEEYDTVIPFMFMTADHDDDTENRGFDNGAMDFIRKPFRPDVLLRRVRNIMQTVDQIQGLKKNASIDSLTGLLNKSASEEELGKVCRTASGALMIIDLDSFKLVNDIYGHSMGDKILINFSDIIRMAVRPADIVGRIGGDEFIAFCHGMLDEMGIAHKSEYINEQLVTVAKELMGQDMSIPLGASIGCVFVPKGGTDFGDLYKKADKALYVVKQNGKHGYNVFGAEKKSAHDEETAAVSMANVEMILGERSQAKGALLLPFEGFRSIYRFLKRTMGIYNKTACILRFSLNQDENPTVPMAEVGEEFINTLASTLRRGDAVTQSGSNQFLVLLSNTGFPELSYAVDRVQKNWESTVYGAKMPFSCEWSVLEP